MTDDKVEAENYLQRKRKLVPLNYNEHFMAKKICCRVPVEHRPFVNNRRRSIHSRNIHRTARRTGGGARNTAAVRVTFRQDTEVIQTQTDAIETEFQDFQPGRITMRRNTTTTGTQTEEIRNETQDVCARQITMRRNTTTATTQTEEFDTGCNDKIANLTAVTLTSYITNLPAHLMD